METTTITNRPLPFDCKILDKKPVRIVNTFSHKHCILEPDAVAVYKITQAAELIYHYTLMHKGLKWLRKYFPKECAILFT